MYRKKTIIYGNRIEIIKSHTARYGVKGEKRRKKQIPTKESVKNANERAAIKRLYRLIMCNFIPDEDMFLTLTYKPEERPTEAESKRILTLFFRRMRKEYRLKDVDLKYIVTTEWNGKNIHHHVIINNCPEFNRIIAKCWPYGGKRSEPLYSDYDFMGLAEYMVKETKETFRDDNCIYRQRYTPSRNLAKPVEIVEIIKSSEWRDTPKVPKSLETEGYILDRDSVEVGTDLFGYPYQTYSFVKKVLRNVKRSCAPVRAV